MLYCGECNQSLVPEDDGVCIRCGHQNRPMVNREEEFSGNYTAAMKMSVYANMNGYRMDADDILRLAARLS